jgi:dihydroxyacid dehydratase/phosphogluconate dehydratase
VGSANGRGAGIDLTLDDFDRIGSHVPLLVDLQPAGRFLMDDFFGAGALLAVRSAWSRSSAPVIRASAFSERILKAMSGWA